MIIECINCGKKFEVNAELIPSSGRNIQCGSCNYVWFFNKNDDNQNEILKEKTQQEDKILSPISNYNETKLPSTTKINKFIDEELSSTNIEKDKDIISSKNKLNFTFFKFLSYVLVLIISFIGFIIIVDTFKFLLYDYFPKLEFLLFSFSETLKDIKLFFKDLL
tara:strand:+ start:123 stop:614 length:492 start_codon:yes stop_codon:yes gene_type:complete